MIKRLGALAWAWVIIVGGVLMITPEGINPIVTKIAGAISAVLGIAAFVVNRRATQV